MRRRAEGAAAGAPGRPHGAAQAGALPQRLPMSFLSCSWLGIAFISSW